MRLCCSVWIVVQLSSAFVHADLIGTFRSLTQISEGIHCLFSDCGPVENNDEKQLHARSRAIQVNATTGSSICSTPRILGDRWIGNKIQYPIPVAEGQGAIVGDDLVIISGFSFGYKQCTNKVFARNISDINAAWQEMDSLPDFVSAGITHAASVVIGTKIYLCGGYYGGHPGKELSHCLIYDHSAPSGTQWTRLMDLPEGRAGGGMVFDTKRNALYFAGGAIRPIAGNAHAEDRNNTWMLPLSNPELGWTSKESIPFAANHISFVTAYDDKGNERHYFVGGQVGENEQTGNVKHNYEWDAKRERWIKRKVMKFTRGHSSESTRAIGCGYILIAGATNEYGLTADISYYNIPTNSWTSIGSFRDVMKTPICDISRSRSGDMWIFCETGKANGKYSFRRQITL